MKLIILEAGIGLGFLAVVMGYFPVLYSAFSRREVSISLLDARAGSPPTAAELMRRHAYEGGQSALSLLLVEWERWSAELLESHISYPLLCYFRSQHTNQSWISALTAVLDTSALLIAGVRGNEARQAQLTFAMARHAMVDLAQIFSLSPVKDAPDRLSRERYDQLYSLLCKSGVSLCRDGHSYERLRDVTRCMRAMPKRWPGYLPVPLPPWIADQPHKDNWLVVAKLRGQTETANPQSHPNSESIPTRSRITDRWSRMRRRPSRLCGPRPSRLLKDLSVVGINWAQPALPRCSQASGPVPATVKSRPIRQSGPRHGPNVGAKSCAGQTSALGSVRGLPPIVGPDQIEAVLVHNAQRIASGNSLNGPPQAIDLEFMPRAASPLGLAIPLIHGVDAIENSAIQSRT